MAQQIIIKVVVDSRDAEANLKRFEREFKSAIDSSTGSVGHLQSSLGGLKVALAALGVGAAIAAFKQLGEMALQAALSVDKARTTFTALLGSVSAANQKLGELRKLVQDSPGVTNQIAQEGFAILKAVG